MKHNHREGNVKDHEVRRWGMRAYARTLDNRSRRREERSLLRRAEIEDAGNREIEEDLLFPKKGKIDRWYYLD